MTNAERRARADRYHAHHRANTEAATTAAGVRNTTSSLAPFLRLTSSAAGYMT